MSAETTLWYVRVDDETRIAGECRLVTRDEFIRTYHAQREMFNTGLVHGQVTVSVTRPDWPVWS